MKAADDQWLLITDYWGNIRWYLHNEYNTVSIALEYIPDLDSFIAGGGIFTAVTQVVYPPTIYGLSGDAQMFFDVLTDHDLDYINGNLYMSVSDLDGHV